MLVDVHAHMTKLQRGVLHVSGPASTSQFPAPVAMAIECLLHQLPEGLAPPSHLLSVQQLDRLPIATLETKLQRLFTSVSPRKSTVGQVPCPRALELLRSLAVYVKLSRAILGVCSEHLDGHLSADEACQAITDVTAEILDPVPPLLAPRSAVDDEDRDTSDAVGDEPPSASDPDESNSSSGRSDGPATPRANRHNTSAKNPRRRRWRRPPPPTTGKLGSRPLDGSLRGGGPTSVAVDPSGIMKRALCRDVGDGSAVMGIMRKFPTDPRIQSHGIRALKSILRSWVPAASATANRAAAKSSQPIVQPRGRHPPDEAVPDGSDSGGDGYKYAASRDSSNETPRNIVQVILDRMTEYPDSLRLQRDALLCLVEFVNLEDAQVAILAAMGGFAAIVNALTRLPDDEDVQVAALSVLAHPSLPGEAVAGIHPATRRLVLSAMTRFPQNERLQGLSCLALTNLGLRDDNSMREIVASGGLELVVGAMNRFADAGLVQAAGSWLLGTVSVCDDELLAACLDSGALPACERARVRFPHDRNVQQHAVTAIESMVRARPGEGGVSSSGRGECLIQ